MGAPVILPGTTPHDRGRIGWDYASDLSSEVGTELDGEACLDQVAAPSRRRLLIMADRHGPAQQQPTSFRRSLATPCGLSTFHKTQATPLRRGL
jgi:hypothetical protein